MEALCSAISGCCGRQRPTRKGKRQHRAAPPVNPDAQPPSLPFEVVFERLVISQNRTTYSHWSVHHKDKNDWMSRVTVRLAAYRGLQIPWSRWTLQRVYAPPHRELDFANLVGGAKPLIDSLIEIGMIKDDSPKHFKCEYSQRKGAVDQTIMTLLEIADGRPADVV